MVVSILKGKVSNIGIAFSSKDRVEFTKRTAPQLLKADADFYWIDGSETVQGYEEPFSWSQNLTEIHTNIRGGAAMAILYALNILYQKGYEYIGLCENDVLLEDGWLERCMDLFKKQVGKPVGAVSARTYQPRILQECGDFAIMANLGAGMIIFKREMVPEILKSFKCTTLQELRAVFKHYGNFEYPVPWCCGDDRLGEKSWVFVHDWFFEAVLLANGHLALAPLPTMARNIDGWAEPYAERDPQPSLSSQPELQPDKVMPPSFDPGSNS